MSGQVFIKETISLVMNLEDERRFPWFCLPYYAIICDQFANGGVKKLIASYFMEMLCSLKFRQRITADSKRRYVKLFCPRHYHRLRSFPLSRHPCLYNKGGYPGTPELTRFLRTSPFNFPCNRFPIASTQFHIETSSFIFIYLIVNLNYFIYLFIVCDNTSGWAITFPEKKIQYNCNRKSTIDHSWTSIVLRWLNTVLRAVRGNLRDVACF